MIHRNCTATATEMLYFEAMDVGLMLRSFRVVMITTVGGKWSWVRAIGRSRRHTESQRLFLSSDVYTRHCHLHVHNLNKLTYPVCPACWHDVLAV